jgi:RHS repeat-associated protein
VLADDGHTYLDGVGRIVQYDATSTDYFGYAARSLTDALGSVRQLADADGQVGLAQSYQPYGEALSSNGEGATSYGFAGEWTDSYSGLMFLRARYYAPYLNQWIQPDPIVPDPNIPADWNRYAYVRNNPINFTDPAGKYSIPHCPFSSTLGCLSFFGAIPDYKGITYVELFELLYGSFQKQEAYIKGKGLHPTTIAAAIAVQSQWLDFPLERLQDALYQLKRSECLPENEVLQDIYIRLGLDSAGLGFAQASYEFGDPHIMANSITAMTERISNGIGWCQRNSCTERDKLIAASMAQNAGFVMEGYVFKEFRAQDVSQPGKIRIEWDKYFGKLESLDGIDDVINNIRAYGRTNYDTRFQLQLMTQDMIVLRLAFKWDLPPEIQMSDLSSMMKLALFGRE